MSIPDNQLPDDIQWLIEASAREETSSYDSALHEELSPGNRLNHPYSVLAAWCFCFFLSAVFYFNPLIEREDLGSRSMEAQLGVAMYHVAHRVETYRIVSGQLPDYIDDSWGDLDKFFEGSDTVEYLREGDSYTLHGQAGMLKVTFRRGDNPEDLLHDVVLFEGARE